MFDRDKKPFTPFNDGIPVPLIDYKKLAVQVEAIQRRHANKSLLRDILNGQPPNLWRSIGPTESAALRDAITEYIKGDI